LEFHSAPGLKRERSLPGNRTTNRRFVPGSRTANTLWITRFPERTWFL